MKIMPLVVLAALFSPVPIYMATHKPELPIVQKQIVESSPVITAPIQPPTPLPSPTQNNVEEKQNIAAPAVAPQQIEEDNIYVNCTLLDGSTHELTQDQCTELKKLEIEVLNQKIRQENEIRKREVDEINNKISENNQAILEAKEQQEKQTQELNLAIDEANQKLYEACKNNVHAQYPVGINGESPERRNLRSQALSKCFSQYN